MNKKGRARLGPVLVVLVIVFLVFLGFGGILLNIGNKENYVEEKAEGKKYVIEYIPSEEVPQLAAIIALEFYIDSNTSTYTCGAHLREGLKELGEKYELGEISEIEGELHDGSITEELIVHIKPKE